MAPLVLLAVIVGLLPTGLAGPACAKKYTNASDCMAMCNQKWGFMGMMMGTDPWGSVMHKETASDDAWNAYIANACGEEASVTASSTTSSSTLGATGLVKALGTQPGAVTAASSTATTVTTASSHSSSSTRPTSSSSSTRFTTSTTTSHTTSTTHTSTSTKPIPTSSSTKTQQTTHVLQEQTTSTHTTAQATHTTAQATHTTAQATQATSSNSGSSNGNSGSSNSNSGGSTDEGNGSNASDADVQAYLDAHNSVRSQHGAVAVTWSNAAASKAQEWADKCTNTHSGGTLGPLGENLAAGTGSFSIAQAVAAWANEVSEYNANNPQPSHFTQMVWKATTQIGCAVQTCDGFFAGFGASQYYVCEYSVQGNVIGNFAANVQA